MGHARADGGNRCTLGHCDGHLESITEAGGKLPSGLGMSYQFAVFLEGVNQSGLHNPPQPFFQ
jgi:hypothetical protein